MTKISNKSAYNIDNSLSGQEFLVGTDDNGQTMSYTLSDIAALVLDVDPSTIDNIPVTLKEVIFDPPIDLETNVDAINGSNQFSVGLKEVCILTSTDGDIKYILKSGSGVYGSGGTQITENDLIVIFDTSAGLVTSVNGEVGDVDVDIKVASVTGDGVNNTDPDNPVLSFPTAEDINAAPLVDGLIPSQYIPGGVDEILEYSSYASFPSTGLDGKIYLALDSNIPYRWGGTVYVPVGSSIALGDTETTAHRGDHGKLAYDRSTYTNTTPMPQAVGGISAGTFFEARTMKQVLDSLLYPYQAPSFTGFSSTVNITGTKEVGQIVATGGAMNLTISASNSSNINNITVTQNGGTPIYDQVAFSATLGPVASATFSRNTVGGITMYTLTGEDSQNGNMNSKTISATWKARIFYGKSTATSLDESGIEGLNGSELVTSTPLNTVKTATGGAGYLYVAIPTNLISDISDIFDEGGANNVPQSATTISITNQYGLAIDYKVYRSNNQFSGTEYKFQLK